MIQQTIKRLEEAHPYTGSIEEASPNGVAFLDLQFFHDLSTRSMAFSPLLKPSALASILNFQSSHPLSVHGSWLKAYLFRLRRRSSSVQWFLDYKNEVLGRLAKFGVDRTILSVLDRETIFTYPVDKVLVQPRRGQEDVLRIVLPYHPLWCRSFNAACAELSCDIQRLDLPGLEKFRRVSVSWSLRGQSLGQVICKY